LRALVAEDACFSRAQLAVKGDDLVKLGLSGPAIGRALDYLLNAVIEEQCPNEKVALLDYWRQHGEK
jgi:tRNA nucleotidyltransferase (CCA-adding enzyme)